MSAAAPLIWQLVELHRRRRPGDILGFYMLRGGAPCVSESYYGYFERFLAEHHLEDVFLLSPTRENDYLGFDPAILVKHLSPAVLIADILVEMESVLRVVGPPGTLEQLHREWKQLTARADTLHEFHAQLPVFIDRLAALPRTRDPRSCPRVVVTGDFFTRFSPFFMEGVGERYAQHGIILKPVDLSDLFLYVAYDSLAETAGDWGLKPGGLALAKACTRVFEPDGQRFLERWWSYQSGRKAEEHYRDVCGKSGLLVSQPNDVAVLFAKSSEHISPKIFGELTPTVGRSVDAEQEGYDGILLIGPFNCLPFRISEAVLRPSSMRQGMPLLTYETDGCAVAPSATRQIGVHIDQVLEHHHRRCCAGPREPTPQGQILHDVAR